MFDAERFEKRIDELIHDGREEEAERELVRALSAHETRGASDHLALIHRKLAFLYVMPATEDTIRAEQHFLKWESLTPAPYTLLQTATFYFYVLRSYSKTIDKVDEIKERFDIARNGNYYSALTLKGESLLSLDKVEEADQVLTEMLAMLAAVGPNGRGRPCGDELNFLSAAISKPALVQHCRELLELVVPRIISTEHAERAKSLLSSLS